MPKRRHHTAPEFVDTPAGVRAYFQDLELLFDERPGLTNVQKKKYALSYLNLENADEWERLSGENYTSDAITYEIWKGQILDMYPGARNENVASLKDIHLLVGKWANTGIYSIDELAIYFRKFHALSQHLLAHGLINTFDQQKYFFNGLPPHIRQQVRMRLMVLHPNNTSRHVYTVPEIHTAAAFVMDDGDAGNDSEERTPVMREPLAPRPSPSAASPPLPVVNTPTLKVEDYVAAVEAMLREKFPQLASGNVNQAPNRPQRSNACSFCGIVGHYARSCDLANRYVTENKCRQEASGRFVMPDGSNIPQGTNPGETLAQRIDQRLQSTASMLSAIRTGAMVSIISPASTSQVSIAPIPSHINQSYTRVPTMAADTTKAPSAYIQEVTSDNEEETDSEYVYETLAAAANTRNRAKGKKPEASATAGPPQPITLSPTVPQPSLVPNSSPTIPHPPVALASAPGNRIPKDTPEYRYATPIEERVSPQKVFDRILASPIQLTAAEVIALSPDIRKLTKEATTTKKIHAVAYASLDPHSQFKYEAHNMPTGLIVGKESHALRSVWPVIDSIGAVECIVDSGCQIIAMSEAVWLTLNKPLNPNIRIRMQSANGSLTESLGVLENISFKFNEVELFFQVHVIRDSAYDVLLGRPFDVLTESMIRNFNNDDQVITITDPNNRDISLAIPTHIRGEPRFKNSNAKGFR